MARIQEQIARHKEASLARHSATTTARVNNLRADVAKHKLEIREEINTQDEALASHYVRIMRHDKDIDSQGKDIKKHRQFMDKQVEHLTKQATQLLNVDRQITCYSHGGTL